MTETKYSLSGLYMITIDQYNTDTVSARVQKKDKNYWIPVYASVNMSYKELEEWLIS